MALSVYQAAAKVNPRLDATQTSLQTLRNRIEWEIRSTGSSKTLVNIFEVLVQLDRRVRALEQEQRTGG